jgi:hypothetical protein
MSSMTIKAPSQRREATSPSGGPENESTERKVDSHVSREQFYRDYREAVRAMRRGDPERFIAYQSDPRIKPCPESLKLPARSSLQESHLAAELAPAPAMVEAQLTFISLMSSVREMVTVLGRVLEGFSKPPSSKEG